MIIIWIRHSLQASIASTHRHVHVFYESMSPQSLEVHFFLIFIFIFETSIDCEESTSII